MSIEIEVVNNKQIEKINTDSDTMLQVGRDNIFWKLSDQFSWYIVYIPVHNRSLMMCPETRADYVCVLNIDQ